MAPRTLKSLIESSGGAVVPAGELRDLRITSVEYDSRKVAPGSLFAAVKGFSSDGFGFIDAALEKGAAAILVSGDRAGELGAAVREKAVVLAAEDMRVALSAVSDAFYGHPSRSMTVIGVTGTNGKTSITYMLESVFRRAGKNPGVIGTVNYRWGSNLIVAPNTTPESKDLQEILGLMRDDGIDTVIMEVSSHALKLRRADHVSFDAALFTNLTRDHMDFHPDFDDYFASKLRLFELLERNGASRRCGIVNADDEYGAKILDRGSAYSYPVRSFGLGRGDFAADPASVDNRITGLRYSLAEGAERIDLALKLSGKFQLYNSLAAFAAARSMGVDAAAVCEGLEALDTIPGRFDAVHSSLGFSAVVDYAHSGDALQKLLQSVRELKPRRLITVFGCGGDRDRTKRPVMGGIAEDLSDFVYVTSDNPRTEDPNEIITEIVAGMSKNGRRIVPDRTAAIREAIMEAQRDDIVVIAGKGHEDYQIIGTTKIHFDDRELARRFIREREAG